MAKSISTNINFDDITKMPQTNCLNLTLKECTNTLPIQKTSCQKFAWQFLSSKREEIEGFGPRFGTRAFTTEAFHFPEMK